jgi:hypothetical protein
MNQTSSQTTSINITSKNVEDHLDSVIVQLAKVLGVEEQCTVEEAIVIVRKRLLKRVMQFHSKDVHNSLNECVTELRKKRMNKSATDLETKTHKLLVSIFNMEE